MVEESVVSAECAEAEHPFEHGACRGCACRCHLRPAEPPARRPTGPNPHNPQRMLDVSEITVGCWVSWTRSEEADGEARGGIVVDIDTLPDEETGEIVRVYSTAKVAATGIRWDRIREDVLGTVDEPNVSLVRALWRAMAREVGTRRATARPDELRMGETIHRLQRSAT